MIPDHETNTVYVSDLLQEKYPLVVKAFRRLLGDQLKTIRATKDIWCRDYMPIQLGQGRFAQFKYDPDYLGENPEDRTENGCDLLKLKTCRRSHVVIDGGNVVRWNDTAILTDKIYKENPGIERPRLRDRLRRTLEVENLVVIPKEPFDDIGHSDGMVRFIDEKTLLVNEYLGEGRAFGKRLHNRLRRKGFELILFPYNPTDEQGTDPGIPPAVGVYINFLHVGNLIVCPIFGMAEDDNALRTLKEAFPKAKIEPLECRALAMEGGVLNCVTWNVRK